MAINRSAYVLRYVLRLPIATTILQTFSGPHQSASVGLANLLLVWLAARRWRTLELVTMTIGIDSKLETRVRKRAQAEQESLALEELNSGEPVEIGPEYWQEKHRRLEQRLKSTGAR